MPMRFGRAALLLVLLLLGPTSLLVGPPEQTTASEVADDGLLDDGGRSDVRLIEPDPDSIRDLQPDGLTALPATGTEPRETAAWTRIGTVDSTGWRFDEPLDSRFTEHRSDLSLVIVEGAADLWAARQSLEQQVVVRAHIPPSGFLVQAAPSYRNGLSAIPVVVSVQPVPIALMVDSPLMEEVLVGGASHHLSVQATGWRNAEGTPDDVFEAPGSIGDLGLVFEHHSADSRRTDIGRHEGSVSVEEIAELAASPAVAWLAAPPDWRIHNDRAQTHMRIAEAAGAFITDLNGSGQVIAVADSGIDQDHGDFDGRIDKVVSVTFNDPSTEDVHSGHGTHVACTVLGSGSRGGYTGVAPEARLYFQAMEDDNSGQFSGASMDYMLRTAYSEGAFIHTNSWGSGTSHNEYTTSAEDVDSRTSRYDQFWSYDGQAVLFSAGNDGTTGISPPATAKNSIAVANHHNRGGSAPDTLAQSSSRGPVDDGRIKPDIAAPGSWVRSCKSQDVTDTDGASWESTWYLEYSGTSMAAPNAAGSAALIREYLMEVTGRPAPQGALIKSMLILGAEDMGGRDIPNNNEGWGRVNLANSLVPGTDVGIFVDDRHFLRSGQQMSYSFNVTRAWSPFKAVLSWSDYEGSTWATKQLQNDLDLELVAPDGTVYLGNDFQNGRSATGGSRDDTNNVEVVLVDSAQLGVWTLQVKDTSHGGGRSDQPFALAVRGVNVNDLRPDPIVVTASFSMSSEIPQVGETITLTVPIANQGSGRANDLVVAASVDSGSLGRQTLHLGPGETRYVDWDWTPVSDGPKTLTIRIDPDEAIEESDEDNNVVSIPIAVSAPGVRLDSNETTMVVNDAGTSSTQWMFRLKNTALVSTNGSVTASKAVRIGDAVEQDWFSSFSQSSFLLNGSEEVWFPFTLVHPSPPSPGFYRVDITARDVDNDIDFPLSIYLSVPLLPDVHFSRPFSTALPVSPVENRSFEVTLQNDGNGAQGYDLELQAPDAWSLGLDDLGTTAGAAGGSTGSIDEGASRQIAITVVPPADMVAAGTQLIGRLIARSQADDSRSWSLDLPLVVAEHDALQIDMQTNLGLLAPDARVSLLFEVENLGNHELAVSPTVSLPGGWSVVGTPASFDLPTGQITYWRITLQGNGQAEGGNLSLHFETAGGAVIDHSVTLEVDNPVGGSLAFSRVILENGSTATTPLGAGDQHTGTPGFVLEWTIANEGSVAWQPTAVLRAPTGDWFTECQESPEILAGEFGSFVCSVIVPNDVSPGSEPSLTLEVDAGGLALSDTISLRIAERRVVSFVLLNADSLVVGSPSTVQVEVTNSGNVRLEHRVKVEAFDGWTARLLDPEVVELQPGETRSLDVEVTPASTSEGMVRVQLMGDGDSVAHQHEFTMTASGRPTEGSSGTLGTTMMIALIVIVLAAGVGISILLRRERHDSGQRSDGMPPVVGGFEAIVGAMPRPPDAAATATAPALATTASPFVMAVTPAAGSPAMTALPAPPATPTTVTPTSAPADTAVERSDVMCWACAESITSVSSRACPACGARYHPLGPEACAHAVVVACRNCGADPSTFVVTEE